MKKRISNRSLSGFTLIEVLVTVAIIGIIVAGAIPSFNNMIKNNLVQGTTDEIVASFQLARTEAVKRKTSVTACIFKSDPRVGTNPSSCTTAAQMNSSTTRYVAIFADTGTIGVYTPGTTDDLIAVSTQLDSKIKFKIAGSGKTYNRYSNYRSDGTSVSSSATQITRFLAVCEPDLDNRFGRELIFANTGRIQSRRLSSNSTATCS